MTFVFQINLNDAAAYDTEHLLPSSGMLYFFYDYDGLASEELSAGHINDWWSQKGNNGYFRIIYVDSSRNELRPSYANDSGQRIVFKAEKTLPDYKDINLLQINVDEDTYQWMADVHCGGEYPKPEKEDWALQYYNDAVLLFQFDFNLETPARVYCFIPRADLQKRDFSNVYFELQEIN